MSVEVSVGDKGCEKREEVQPNWGALFLRIKKPAQ